MPKKKSSVNWKTILGSIALIGVGGGWMVTAKMTETNAGEIKETQHEVADLKEIVYEQRIMNTQQFAINESLVELLKKKK